MRIRTKVEIIGGFIAQNPISFPLNDVSFTFFTINGKNYVEATRQVIDYKQNVLNSFNDIMQYAFTQEKRLLDSLKCIESIGSFLIRIQEIKYDEREIDWIAETNEDKMFVDRLPKVKCSLEKDNSVLEISQIDIKRVLTLCSTITGEIYAFELLRLGNVSFINDRFYFAFINFFMILEEAFGKGDFRTNALENNFMESKVLKMCILSAIDMLYRNPLSSLYVEWMQKEVKRRNKNWDLSGVIFCIVKFRGDYFHSGKRTKVLEQRDQYFKYIAAFIQAICLIYCSFLIVTADMSESEVNDHVENETEAFRNIFGDHKYTNIK